MSKQMELPTNRPYEVRAMKHLPDDLVACCDNWQDAVMLCMEKATVRRTRAAWAEFLGYETEGALSTILNSGRRKDGKRRRLMDPDLFEPLQQEAGNRAIDDYFELKKLGRLNHQRVHNRKAELLEELKQIEQQEALLHEDCA